MASKSTRILQMAAYLMLTAIFVIIIGIARNCSRLNTDPVEGFSGGDTLDIALLYGPGSLYFYGDSLTGINNEIAAYFSSSTNTPIKIWPVTDPASGLEKLETGAYDIVASLPLDNTLKKNFKVSESIFLDRLVLIQLQDSTPAGKEVVSSLDLNGRKVYVAQGSSASIRLTNLSEEIGGRIEIEEVPELSDELICLKVATGDFPLAVVNEKVAKKIAESYPSLHFDSSVSFTQFQVWIFNPSDSVSYRKFNDWFDIFRQSDIYRSILNNF